MRKTDLYFESHVTIEPVFDERLEEFKEIAAKHGFRVADLLMKKRSADSAERSQYDTFATSRSTDWDDIYKRTAYVVHDAALAGFKVWRYKIEDTLIDVRMN